MATISMHVNQVLSTRDTIKIYNKKCGNAYEEPDLREESQK
jgi:hypothetical protein